MKTEQDLTPNEVLNKTAFSGSEIKKSYGDYWIYVKDFVDND
jgi:hypothetical protein